MNFMKILQFTHTWMRIKAVLVLIVLLSISSHAWTGGQETDPDLDTYFDMEYDDAYEQRMVQRIRGQINRYLLRYTDQVAQHRDERWDRDLSSAAAYRKSIELQRQELREILGIIEEREAPAMYYVSQEGPTARVSETARYTIDQVRWPVIDGIHSEGLLLTPKGDIRARVVAMGDADQTPEQLSGLAEGLEPESQFARRLAASGVQVLVPALISRDMDLSATETYSRRYWMPELRSKETIHVRPNQTHREVLWRQAFVMGRHLVGYEVQKVLAGLDWFEQQDSETSLGVVGYGEGGLLAFYAAAVDPRIDVAMVSGYFQKREWMYEEPIERLIWGFLQTFGDAEVASLITPRKLIVEYSRTPEVELPKELPLSGDLHRLDRNARKSGQKGRLSTPSFNLVNGEVKRFEEMFKGGVVQPNLSFVHGENKETVSPGSREAIHGLLDGLGGGMVVDDTEIPLDRRRVFDPKQREKRLFNQISNYLEQWFVESDFDRYRFFDGDFFSPQAWKESMEPYRRILYEEVIGQLPASRDPVDPNPRMRKVFEEETWTGYEVIWDALPGVHGWGLLAVPNDLQEGEQRPTVVTQHGAGGTPTSVWKTDSYSNLLPQLMERGFVVFAPHNPYSFDIRRVLPVQASVFSFIIPGNQQMMRWLTERVEVDASRIGYYGKSLGGWSALNVTPFIPELRFSICSAHFNLRPSKTASRRYGLTFMYTPEIREFRWKEGVTFGNAEMAQLLVPRPFLVENGYFDNVMYSEWAAYEFDKVRRTYDLLGIGDRAVRGNHVTGHNVHGDTIFPFIHKHLNHPVPVTR